MSGATVMKRARCQALDMNGRRCRRLAYRTLRYHGDAEIYGYDSPNPQWVLVSLCIKHYEPEGGE